MTEPTPARPEDGAEITPLRRARLDRGLTLRTVSEQTGIAFGYISDLELGKRPAGNVSLRHARALSVVLCKPVNILFPCSETDAQSWETFWMDLLRRYDELTEALAAQRKDPS